LYKFGFLKKFEKKVGHLRRYSEKDLKQKLEQVGFNVISIKKTEGIFRNMLFVYDVFGILIKMANKFPTFGNVLSFVDKISLKLFGSSQVILLAEKP
ncbi:MAG: hypothetical protein M1514_02510, partial [Patescibacteria group bacterium]|nr:hypothetical protein [Patescibacteria group bacterium]